LEPDYPLSYLILLSGIGIKTPDFKIVIGFLVILVLLLGSALMSASEVAFFSLGPEDLEKLKTNKDKKIKNSPEFIWQS